MSPSLDSSLSEWLQYIEAIHPTEIDLGLDRLHQVADRLLDKSSNPFVFSVAGTNGKGTTTAAISAMLSSTGHSVGWYSSPHLFLFNERIRINGIEIEDSALVSAFFAVESARGSVTLSYFEFTTLAAFYAFQKAEVDAWVLEVGLGGRLDAVNIIDPDVSIITNIGLDHQGFLGNTLEEIGREKAGICREGKPVVLASSDLPQSINDEIVRIQSVPSYFGQSHGVSNNTLFWSDGEFSVNEVSIPHMNAASALQAFSFSPFSITQQQIGEAFRAISLPGRMQKFTFNGRPIIVDVGHNPHAAKYISSQISSQKIHILLGMLSDKDPKGFYQELKSQIKTLNLIDLEVPRGLSSMELSERLETPECQKFRHIGDCIEYLDQHYPQEPLFIGGSFYTVCDALTFLESSLGS